MIGWQLAVEAAMIWRGAGFPARLFQSAQIEISLKSNTRLFVI